MTEKTYDSVHAGCTDKQLDGTLTFVRVVKLYTHRCFQKYPHFQLDDLTQDKKELSNNATSFMKKGKDVVQEKEEVQEKDEVAVMTDPELSPATEIKVLTPILNPDKKGKERAETKKANRDPALVPLAIANRKIHAAIAAVKITLLAPVTKDRIMRKMVRQNHHTSRQISTLPSRRRP